ncbi:tyrosine-type recombinase/integrase [Lactococcus nasutitermitis]|uniref:Tyrosine-type recombinase/integrase n=1 Tax=Lactococcus nasutitermitis TaxID=1652957 RepID=A0ABV9JDN3_9LACT|nr:site-specific integrase [Lactococcus nasutitermitis]
MFYKKLENGKYRFYEKFKIGGIQKQVSITLSSKTRVMQAMAKKMLADKIALSKNNVNLISSKATIGEIREQWICFLKKSISENSVESYLSSLKDFFNQFNKYQVNKLTPAQLQAYFTHNNWAFQTIKHKKNVMAQFFKYAVRVGYLKKSPLENVMFAKKSRTTGNTASIQEKYITKDEFRAILDYCNSNSRLDKRHIYLMESLYLTGIRLEEAGAIQTEGDFDLNKKTLKITKAINTKATVANGRKLYSTKTDSSFRTISLSSRSVEIIRWFLENKTDNNFLFANRNGNVIQQSSCWTFVHNVCSKALNDNKQKFNNHILRHSHISLLAEAGLPLKAIMERVGHTQEATTLRIYNHVSFKMRDSIGEKLNELSI